MAYYRSKKRLNISSQEQTGSIVTFNSQYAGLPLKSHKIDLTATQSGSGTPSPDNVRTINGYSAINIGAVGANVWDKTTKLGYYRTSSGRHIDVSDQLCSNTFIAVQPNITYRFIKPNTRGDVLYYDIDKTYLNQYYQYPPKNGTFTTPNDCYYITINLGNDYGATYNNDLFIAYPSGSYTTIQIASTVYGGEYDARTGLLTEMPTAPTLDKNSNWNRNASGIFYIPTPTGMTDLTMCNMFEVIGKGASSGLANYQCRMSTNGQFINFCVNSCDTLEDFKTWLGDNVITIWGVFTNTTTIQLPPCPIDTLQGENNIWADTGETTVSYIKIGG